MEDWAEIRRLHRAEQMPIKAIVRKLGVSRNAVRRALAAEHPPKYERPAKGSLVDVVELQPADPLGDHRRRHRRPPGEQHADDSFPDRAQGPGARAAAAVHST